MATLQSRIADTEAQTIWNAIHRGVVINGLKATAIDVSFAFERYIEEHWAKADPEEAHRLVEAIRNVKWTD